MGLFNKIFRTSDKIRVQFINNLNGDVIGVSDMNADQLPETFSVQTTMHIQDADWNIEQAIPENSIDFIKTKSLVLKMRKIEKMDPTDIWYTLPTISNEFAQTEPKIEKSDLDINIHEDDYRQKEFLNVNSLPKIEEEFKRIKEIWTNYSKKSEEYTLFKNCHVRKTIGSPNLSIDINKIQTLLNCDSIGQVIINGEILSNGFNLKTDNTTYFGIRNNENVIELCISQWNNNTTNEILKINKEFDVLFVDWFNYDLIEND